jgi:hypothetical protein
LRPDLQTAHKRRGDEQWNFAQRPMVPATTLSARCWRRFYAYERVLSGTHGKKTRASRTWQMIDRHGILPAVERVVSRSADSAGYAALVKMGLQDMAFEAVVLRHPDLFSAEAVARSNERLRDWMAATKS